MTRPRSEAVQFDFGDFEAPRPDTRYAQRAVVIGGQEVGVTPVFFAYWHFAAERQNIFFRRLRRSNSVNVTSDPILSRFKFTNAYRASDRVSQYLIRNVIYRDDLPSTAEEIFFRTLVFKLFNKIETWEHLEQSVGPITLRRYNFSEYDAALTEKMSGGDRIYSAAYIMPSAGSAFSHKAKHRNHLMLLEQMLRHDFPRKLRGCDSMAEAYALMLSAPSIGPFLAYQYTTDLNYSELTDFSESTFVVAGPGALDGISKCFKGATAVRPEEIIKYMFDNQERYFSSLSIEFPSLWGRRLQLIDCQNIFCEISKYARVAFPQISGVSGRTRIKQKFTASGPLPSPWYPPKWNLNAKIQSDYLATESFGSASTKAVQPIAL